MKKFMDDTFLLQSNTAIDIYTAIKDLPIIDYHCHLDPEAIANNWRYENITHLWLGSDHYKWRLMRSNGVPESHITGDAPDQEKFAAWCATLEVAIGSPLYHWSHLELKRYFDFDGVVTSKNAAEIYVHCNTLLEKDEYAVHGLLKRSRVEMLATTDDPADTLKYHAKIQYDEVPGVAKVRPTFRPGLLLDPANPAFGEYVKRLELAANQRGGITDWETLLTALESRLDFFAMRGCNICDHALDPPVFDAANSETKAALVFRKALRGETLTHEEAIQYKSRMFMWLGAQYKKRDWVMQLHMGAMRNNNARMLGLLGADTGYDSMGDKPFARPLAKMLDALEKNDELPRTILYALNPTADEMLATMMGNFQGRGIKGRIQWGAPWWFNDHKPGMQKHLITLGSLGMLANFVGMLTDSRSFISYPRHEYFRRILANQMGTWVQDGEFPHDMELLTKIASDIAYYNAKGYFA
ncbi:MAG: glucuronate isomerase [Defluviitaleaceae bacterium]|nr:glucuronate isomerase [Defluviitaleaceae bacterium]MCL2276195.1 glucuronate isomerase [Defluviitaleaceae bacterium]